MSKDNTAVLSQIVKALEPLSSEERHRVVQAALTFLGDVPLAFAGAGVTARKAADVDDLDVGDGAETLPKRAIAWMRQNQLSQEGVSDAFHVEHGEVEFIGEAPGRNTKERMLNTYLLAGVARLLATGDAKFDDAYARELCQKGGCYDAANHASNLKDIGNALTGSKSQGWTLTGPGLKQAAALVKQLGAKD